jgi:phage head maturation protease
VTLSAISLVASVDILASAANDASPSIPRFSMVAYSGGLMRIAGSREPVVVDLAGMAIPSQSRPIRLQHDAAAGVGHTDSVKVTAGVDGLPQLIATGIISRNTPAAEDVVSSSKNGFPWQASIGANIENQEFIPAGKTGKANGRSFAGPVNIVRKSTLGEISFVDLGADTNTSARVAAQFVEHDLVAAAIAASRADAVREIRFREVSREAAAATRRAVSGIRADAIRRIGR